MKAAGGPLSGNLCLYQSEQNCVQGQNNAGWFPTLVHAEQSDSQRTHLFPCADFTGSYTGSNQVFAWRSANLYDTPAYAVTKSPNEYFVNGGSSGDDTPTPSGPFVARMDPTTGQQVWRTVLDNVNASGQWNVGAAINLPADGNPVVEYGYQLAKLDAQTGRSWLGCRLRWGTPSFITRILLQINHRYPKIGLWTLRLGFGGVSKADQSRIRVSST